MHDEDQGDIVPNVFLGKRDDEETCKQIYVLHTTVLHK